MNTNKKPGIAVDIDDTLSDTLHHFIGRLKEKFGAPDNMSVEEIIEKYKFTARVPFWQTPEIQAWLEKESQSNEAQEAIPVLGNAQEILWKIHEILPVRMYITSRPSIVEDGTVRWLRKHNFPSAPVITRPMSKLKIDGNAWKADILEQAYPSICGIIDDNPEIVTAFSSDYKGTVYLFNHIKTPIRSEINVKFCPTWQQVLETISSGMPQDMV